MKLRTRLIISFFIIVCVPVLLTCIALLGLSSYQLNVMKESYGVSDLSYESLSDTMQMLTKSTQKNFENMQEEAIQDPDRFLEMDYLTSLNEELTEKESYLILRVENELYYKGIEEDITAIFQELPDYEEGSDSSDFSDSGVYIGNDVNSFVKQVNLEFSNGTSGSAFIITKVDTTIKQMKVMARNIVIAIIVILIFTSGILTTWVYTGLNKPLNRLKLATKHIKEGNMDYSLADVQGKDELSQLCQDFEEMRIWLRTSAEQRAEDNRENKELISNISHDLKTPITAVKGYVEGIMDGVADTPEKMDRYIRTIYNKANDMDRLINELTFYARIDTNRIPYTFSQIKVSDYFDDCFEEVGVELESKKIELAYFNHTDKDTMIIADVEQIKRVINNIIGNSVKYMDKSKGYISIRVDDVGDFIQVEIEDNGMGIAEKDLPYIFDRFYRSDPSRNPQGGSGIGLSIVRKIVEDHGGKIWASSKLGVGTTMHFVLRKYQEVPINE